ncbi:MAG: hypothetical protein J5966_02265 [Lachnospiraceae bacterium]|nr:hypothetical protein [Lachnospiraceae bacterium]
MQFEIGDTENCKIELHQFIKFYTELSKILKKDNCDYFYIPTIPTETKKYAITPIITKDTVIMRVRDKEGSFHNSCHFDDIKETRSGYQERLFRLISEHKQQLDYPRGYINKWMHELAEIRERDFVQNSEIYDKYERVRRRLEKAYGIVPSAKDIKNVDTQKTESPSDQEIRAAAFIRDNRTKADAMAAIDREIKNPANQPSDTLTAKYNKARTELSKAIYKYAAYEIMSGTSEKTTMEAVKELFKGTGCNPEPYLKEAAKVYSQDIRDAKKLQEHQGGMRLL